MAFYRWETFTPLFSHLTLLSPDLKAGSLSSPLFLSSQIVCKIYSRIQWEIHFKNKNKTQNIINFITRSENESYRFDPAVVQTVQSEHPKHIFIPFSFQGGLSPFKNKLFGSNQKRKRVALTFFIKSFDKAISMPFPYLEHRNLNGEPSRKMCLCNKFFHEATLSIDIANPISPYFSQFRYNQIYCNNNFPIWLINFINLNLFSHWTRTVWIQWNFDDIWTKITRVLRSRSNRDFQVHLYLSEDNFRTENAVFNSSTSTL